MGGRDFPFSFSDRGFRRWKNRGRGRGEEEIGETGCGGRERSDEEK